jgi:hypothetical protein
MKDATEVIAALDALDGGDPESAHCRADELLMGLVPDEVRQAYNRVVARCAWWAYS